MTAASACHLSHVVGPCARAIDQLIGVKYGGAAGHSPATVFVFYSFNRDASKDNSTASL